ncbi:MAG: FG-GAP-like repeat-containing protein [Cytophagales bacterium]|nr:FG-GAP-like repeat-containing protein [Cytophagales bacterium]
MKHLCLAFAFLVFCTTAHSQNIRRKGGLGIAFYQNVPDSLAKRLDYRQGAIVQLVVPNGTAAGLGLAKDDIILKVNNDPINQPNEILKAAAKLRSKDPVTVEILRNRKRLTLTGTTVEKPYEKSATADVVYGEFAYKNGYVRTIYKTPKNKKPLGTVYFLQGLPCYSLDNLQELDKTKQAIDAMVDRGYAVFRMEKGDMGDNTGLPPCLPMGFFDELAMYEAGYRHLLTLPQVDKFSVFLFGHSMGGITAPLLAQQFQPRGVVVYGTVFKPWLEYLCDAYIRQAVMQGEDYVSLRESLEKAKPHFYDYFYKNVPLEEVLKNPDGMAAFQLILGYNPATQIFSSGRSPLCYKELNASNVAGAWGNYQNHVLAIYGECDLAAIDSTDHAALINLINANRPGNGTFWFAPKSSHGFEEIGTMAEFLKLHSNPQAYNQYAAQRFNPKIFDYTCNWMSRTLQQPFKEKTESAYRDASDNLPELGARKASMDVRAMDVDQDGDLDIVLANEFQPNSILVNDGKGNFTDESEARLPQVVHDSEDVAIADFNGDGLTDLVFCSEDDKVHEYYLNKGKGFFQSAPYKLPDSEANAVITFDVNKDKKPDLVFGNNGPNAVLINKGDGTFTVENNRLPGLKKVTQDLAAVDVDSDGDLDIFEANEDGNALLLNNGKGFFTDATATHLPKDPNIETRKASFADVDKDGDPDLFLSNVRFRPEKDIQNRLYINNGKGKFANETSRRLPKDEDHTIDGIFEDVNKDGHMDIVLANVFGGPIKVYANNGKGEFTDATTQLLGKTYVRDALGVIAADLNNDGKKDLYFCDRFNPAVGKKDLLLLAN